MRQRKSFGLMMMFLKLSWKKLKENAHVKLTNLVHARIILKKYLKQVIATADYILNMSNLKYVIERKEEFHRAYVGFIVDDIEVIHVKDWESWGLGQHKKVTVKYNNKFFKVTYNADEFGKDEPTEVKQVKQKVKKVIYYE